MLDRSLITEQHDNEEYINHAMTFNDNPEESEARFAGWFNEHHQDLKQFYIDDLKENVVLVLEMSFPDWCRQMFICWDYNVIQCEKLKDDLDFELRLQQELQAMGI